MTEENQRTTHLANFRTMNGSIQQVAYMAKKLNGKKVAVLMVEEIAEGVHAGQSA